MSLTPELLIATKECSQEISLLSMKPEIPVFYSMCCSKVHWRVGTAVFKLATQVFSEHLQNYFGYSTNKLSLYLNPATCEVGWRIEGKKEFEDKLFKRVHSR